MPTRTVKLIGKAYSTDGDVSIAVNFNNQEVYNGTVTTINSVAPQKGELGVELASWTVDTDLSGAIPMTIAVTGGSFQFNDLQGSHTGFELQDNGLDPSDPDYGWLVTEGAYTVITAPADYYGNLNINSASSDGKDNVTFSGGDGIGDPPARTVINADETLGDWIYTIEDGQTFGCNFRIDADMTVLDSDIPTPSV